MSGLSLESLRFFGRRVPGKDRVALSVVLLYGLVWLGRAFGWEFPLGGLVGLLFLIAAGYFLIRLLAWARRSLLWSLRNRLMVAYLFIAVVPVFLLLVMAGLSAFLIYAEIGAYLLHNDIQRRIERVASIADGVAAAMIAESSEVSQRSLVQAAASPALRPLLAAAGSDLPGLRLDEEGGEALLGAQAGPVRDRFAGVVQSGDQVSLRAVVARRTALGRLVVSVSVPVTSELLETLAPELGPIQLTVTRPAASSEPQSVALRMGSREFMPAGLVTTRRRALPPPAHWFDYEVRWLTTVEAISPTQPRTTAVTSPVFASFTARPSQLNRRLFASLGELADWPTRALVAVGIFFLVIEVVALRTGIMLTRTITCAVDELYGATQHVQAGDFSHRVRIQERDQLGVLGESFNAMTSSISSLIEEQRHLQRLENELAIAQQVQSQLFPQVLPALPGIELGAFCRAARGVGGDFYDLIQLSPTELGIAVADISGKGISAALLMASLQAAMRSQVLSDGDVSQSTAGLVAHLNRHLFRNTSQEKYATLFYAVYDTASRVLRYTNAGHMPPLCFVGEQAKKLETGGMVVGLFAESSYQEEAVRIDPGSLLVAYSDGLTEPENVYGEEFGSSRLVEEVLRHRHLPASRMAESLVAAAEEWAGSPEQSDDMTVIVVRMS